MKLLGISGTIVGSKTGIAVQSALQAAKQFHPDIETEYLDMKDYQVQFCDGRDPSAYTGDTKTVIDIVSSADCYIIGTPIFQSSITGVLKNLFDLVPTAALYNKVMGFVATGGTYQHYLVVENQLKPIAGYLRAFVAPSYVYLHDDHFNAERQIADPDVRDRLERLAREVVFMNQKLKG
ncbi:NADH-dependent FMN reductase [Paenibacillus dendritiformis]|uniref:NADPH-dependent FMN reductase n=1 Tax=Paenibacillus dendritiformis TaxID=130049 RepID=UPI0018CD81EC|nr:NAD(P)H-dependent oxidoreductase [Paenibacillus dendritiformis]MBG9791343.1 NADH-dependent FMN reductase [Paenibacillus dendritiformis]